MQPLTPSERREVEEVKEELRKSYNQTFGIQINDNTEVYDKDLWLKVLSMALEHSETLMSEWRKR